MPVIHISTMRARGAIPPSSSWQINGESITGGITILLFQSEATTARVLYSEPIAAQPTPPGTSMLAKRLPIILPAMTLAEAIETMPMYHVGGLTGDLMALMTTRPLKVAGKNGTATRPQALVPPS
jgi:hypothetical protein